MRSANADILHAFTFKVASRCNLNCSYCYVYNQGDDSWKGRPPIMSDTVFRTGLTRIKEYCRSVGRRNVSLTFHGGEPCLAGTDCIDRWCDEAHQALDDVAKVRLVIQTNGTLIDDRWVDLFKRQQLEVGVSLDGPRAINDRERKDHKGRGSYNKVVRGLNCLRDHDVEFAILTVIPLGADGAETHRHLASLGPSGISYIMPDNTYETIHVVRGVYGRTPCSDFLIPVFDEWWFHGTLDLSIQPFWAIVEMILGGESRLDNFGMQPLGFLFIETDGTIEGLDVLRVCGNGMAKTEFNVLEHSFHEFAEGTGLHQRLIFDGRDVPPGCQQCAEVTTCAGGYIPHRYSRATGFANPSVWCEDILALFRHMRVRLEVSAQETLLRRQALREVWLESAADTPASIECHLHAS